VFGLELVDHRAPETSDPANLRAPENLYGRRKCSGLNRHVCGLNVWFRKRLGELLLTRRVALASARLRAGYWGKTRQYLSVLAVAVRV
jgi:hypothetical protein